MMHTACGIAALGRALLGAALLCWAASPAASPAEDAEPGLADKAVELRRRSGRKNAGRVLVVDFADQVGIDDEPRLGGGTAGMGRFFRDIFAAAGGEAVDLETTLDALRRLDFRIDDCHDGKRVGALMDAVPGADRLIHGFIAPTANPSVLQFESMLLAREDGEIVASSVVGSVAVDGDMELLRGDTYPPLSDNLPNTVLTGHPFSDPDALFRMEILDRDGGARELRIRNDRAYVAGGVGGAFSVRLTNNSAHPAAVALFIDAKPAASADGEVFLPSNAPKYLVPARSSTVISGWGDGGGPRFSFGRSPDSDRQTRNYWDAVGVISAAFYPVVPENMAVIWDIDREKAWRAKILPASGSLLSSATAADRRGRKRDVADVAHASSPGAILSVHYDASARVGNYRTLGR
ncbi:MAG: hypothetical protein LBT97_12960 [Planctomycetota bacterium]|jgi:hypothetical protein|nr:hypothetical protein [Planctomycetota bacterium]